MTSTEEKIAKLSKAIEDFLRGMDRSPGKFPELVQTPVRTAATWLEDLVDGYEADITSILSGGSAASGKAEMIVVRDIFFHSVCLHHLLPFHGRAHVAYIPGDKIIGLTKITRLVEAFAHRLTLQEDIGRNVVDSLVDHLGVKGAACLLDAEQLCMVVRGVRKPGTRVTTVSYAGNMQADAAAKAEFLATVNAEEQ